MRRISKCFVRYISWSINENWCTFGKCFCGSISYYGISFCNKCCCKSRKNEDFQMKISEPNLEKPMILVKKGTFLGKKKKRARKNFTTPYSISFLSVLHQNKALHNFHKRGQCPIAGHIKGLD